MLFDKIANHCVDWERYHAATWIHYFKKWREETKKTTKGWEILIQYKDGSMIWDRMKFVNKCYPLQLAGYSYQV